MKILVVGGGGREHAIIKKLLENNNITKIYALPGNGGIAKQAECVDINAKDIFSIRDFAVKEKIDFAVVAPDDPLVLGAVDLIEEAGIPCFGPSKAAAEIEGSKVFSKNLMEKYNIPTAFYKVFDSSNKAKDYIKEKNTYPIVIKADGLALGKGVIIAEDEQMAFDAVDSIMTERVFGDSGKKIIVEEFLTGPEVTVLAFTDGKTIIPMVSSMDHKKALDGDIGPNTGGMGVIAPSPFYTNEIAETCMNDIFIPTINAMNNEGRKFKGCLYFGLILTKNGPMVIEYNCRFGDPEAQVVLPLLKTDLFEIMNAISEERLSEIDVQFSDNAACCIVIASGGYPAEFNKGYEINIGELTPNAELYFAGVKLEEDKLVTSGGRVITVCAIAKTLTDAIDLSYENLTKIEFENMFYRKDIGKKALQNMSI